MMLGVMRLEYSSMDEYICTKVSHLFLYMYERIGFFLSADFIVINIVQYVYSTGWASYNCGLNLRHISNYHTIQQRCIFESFFLALPNN